MINSKLDLIEYMSLDNIYFNKKNRKTKIFMILSSHSEYKIVKFTRFLRKQEYFGNTSKGNKCKIILHLYYEKRKNILGNNLGIFIEQNCFGKGLQIYHHGSIIVNPTAKIGDNCSLRGNNCIGYSGKSYKSPVLGDNVQLGFGAVIIGDIKIANDIKIGANAVVTKSFLNSGEILVGIPANVLKKK